MSKHNLSYQEILEHLMTIDGHVHLPYREFAMPIRGSSMKDIALGMMMHVGLIGYEPIIKYAKLDEGTGGHISLNNNPDRKVIITLSNATGVLWESELATLAHEICHKLLYANNCYFPDKGEYNETLTDIATIYAGFGKLTINGCEIQTSKTDFFGTQTTTHYTGYLVAHNYITAYKIVCSVNNVPKKDYEAGLDRSKLDTLRYYEGMKYLRDIGRDIPSVLKSLRIDTLSRDSACLRDIIQIEEYIKELKQEILQHQKDTIKKYDGIENNNGDIISPYGVLFIQTIGSNVDRTQKSIEQRFNPFGKILKSVELKTNITNLTLNIKCPVCGFSKENALKEHKKTLIRCPKCKRVFYWDASLPTKESTISQKNKTSLLNRIKSLFKRL